MAVHIVHIFLSHKAQEEGEVSIVKNMFLKIGEKDIRDASIIDHF